MCTANNSVEVEEYMRKQEPAREVCFHAPMNQRGMLNCCIGVGRYFYLAHACAKGFKQSVLSVCQLVSLSDCQLVSL